MQPTKLTAVSLCSGVPKWNAVHHLHQGVNTGDNAAISCKNLVNGGAVIPEITFLICLPSYGYWAKMVFFDDLRSRI